MMAGSWKRIALGVAEISSSGRTGHRAELIQLPGASRCRVPVAAREIAIRRLTFRTPPPMSVPVPPSPPVKSKVSVVAIMFGPTSRR